MAKKENSESISDSNLENENPYIEDVVSEKKASWLSSRAAKITAIAVGSSLALGAAFAGGAVAGQLAGGARGGEFGMSQSGPEFNGGGPGSDGSRHGGPEGQRPPHNEGEERSERRGHDGPKSFVPPMQMPAPSSTTAP
jgi:hypothetical protein